MTYISHIIYLIFAAIFVYYLFYFLSEIAKAIIKVNNNLVNISVYWSKEWKAHKKRNGLE